MNITPAMSLHGSMQDPNQVPQGSFTPMSPYHPHLAHMVHPGTFLSSPPNTNGVGVGVPQQQSQQSVLTDIDVQRIAVAVKGLLVTELNNAIEPLKDQIISLQNENEALKHEIDNLEMYSRRSCVRVSGVSEECEDTDQVLLDIAQKLDVPLKQADIEVSHWVGPKNPAKPRQIIARIKNYELRHRLLKSSKDLRNVTGMDKVAINQDLTKTRNKLAYEARQLVKTRQAKSTFVWDGKIFVIDFHDRKHKILNPKDMSNFLAHIGGRQTADG